ncbi:MAG: DUF1653 domain-containing protein [Candidatus Babeliales bacterium]
MANLVDNSTNKRDLITPGNIYTHYKGKQYQVLHIVFSENDALEEWVVYQGLYDDPKLGKNPIFTRPLKQFCEIINFEGTEQPRFNLFANNITRS